MLNKIKIFEDEGFRCIKVSRWTKRSTVHLFFLHRKALPWCNRYYSGNKKRRRSPIAALLFMTSLFARVITDMIKNGK